MSEMEWRDIFAVPERKKQETAGLLDQARASCSDLAERLDGAETLKAQANKALGDGDAGLALRTYLAALWLLRLEDPPLPQALVEPSPPSGSTLLGTLGLVAPEDRGSEDDPACALRVTLLLNVAAAALRLDEWMGARAASEFVLAHQPSNHKALYRLARAHEGAGELGAALRYAGKLIALDPTNLSSSRLAAELRSRAQKERRMYGGLFERAREEGGDGDGDGDGDEGGDGDSARGGPLYSDADLAAEERRRREEKARSLRLSNLAKLPPEMWAEQVRGLSGEEVDKLAGEEREIASQMPDASWVKQAAKMDAETMRAARAVAEATRQRAAAGGADADAELDAELDEASGVEKWFDWLLDWLMPRLVLVAGVVAVLAVLFHYLVHVLP